MTKSFSSSPASGLDFLIVAFIVLKLCGVIDWSWWWVLSPAWGMACMLGFFSLLQTYCRWFNSRN